MRRLGRLAAVGTLVLMPVVAGACADEDGDGATTDEEIQDVRDGADKAGDRVETEIDGQDDGSNSNDGTADDGGTTTTTAGG
jgi:hypothetical protein